MFKSKVKSAIRPHHVVDSVLHIDVAMLRQSGVRYVVFDVDETLVQSRKNQIAALKVQHINSLRQAGLNILIGSNSRRDLSAIAESIGAVVVPASRVVQKPRKKYYHRITEAAAVPPHQIMMVGDRLLNDVVAAKRAGLKTTLVRPVKRRPGMVFLFLRRRYG
ncbi:YqeG family HAD IIIA-type phosphatase [Patescibacteria group bacterium]|nr:MAG: YqeG family HAD IIIA-type phosphatase [Patescibacteria group bacterium]